MNSHRKSCSMAMREAAWRCVTEAASLAAPRAPGPGSPGPRPSSESLTVVLWRPASRGRQLLKARIMDAGPGHSGHVVSPGPVAAPMPSSRGRHTAGLCQRRDGRVAQQPVDPLGLGVGVPTRRPGRSGGSMACLTCRLCSQITSRFVSRAWPGGGQGGA